MSDLITLEQAQAQVRVLPGDDDTTLAAMVTAASAIVVSYLQTAVAAAYDVTTAPGSATFPPPHVQTAVLLVLASLYEDREGANDPIGVAVRSVLERDRDPALI